MSTIKKVNIYVGAVGSAYVDKTTAQTNYRNAQNSVLEAQQIIVTSTNLKTLVENAINDASYEYTRASQLLSYLDNKIIASTGIKQAKLEEIKSALLTNDTDDIYQNGGNVETAEQNVRNAQQLLQEVLSIIQDANILLEDNQRLVITREQELIAANEKFNTYAPYNTESDGFDSLEGSIKEKLDAAQNQYEIIVETTNNVATTTSNTYDLIENVLDNSDTPEQEYPTNTYWYCGQTIDLNSNVFIINDNDTTESDVNSWHILTYTVKNETNYLIKGIDSMSRLEDWYIIVPDNLTPVLGDLVSVDTNYQLIKQVTVNNVSSKLYKVSNRIAKIINAEISRLNIIMSTGEVISPDSNVYGYWYVGRIQPTSNINPNSEMADTASDPGWRKITQPFSTYINPNSLMTERIGFSTTADTYIILPQYFDAVDSLGISFLTLNNYVSTFIYNSINYNVYKLYTQEFLANVYYTNQSEQGPQGEQGQQGEPSSSDNNYYIYIGTETPVTIDPANNLVNEPNEIGWRNIGTSLSTYNVNNPAFNGGNNTIELDPNYNDITCVVIIPTSMNLYDGMGNMVSFTQDSTISINNKNYKVLSNTVGGEFNYNIY